jgi:hypothetical protein
VNKYFENNIVSLVKIQIDSNSIFCGNKKKSKNICKKTRTNSEQIVKEIFQK